MLLKKDCEGWLIIFFIKDVLLEYGIEELYIEEWWCLWEVFEGGEKLCEGDGEIEFGLEYNK